MSSRFQTLRLGIAAACTFAASLAWGQSTPLTLDEALRLATLASSSSKAAQASVQASAEAALRSDQLPDPTLKVGIDNLPVSGQYPFSASADFMTMRRIGIEQQWVSADKRQARQERARRAVESAQGAYLENSAMVREETGKAWLSLLYAQRALALYQLLEKDMRDDLAGAQAALRGARAAAADVLQAQLDLAQSKDDSLRAAQEVTSARIGLARWVRAPVDAVADAPPALTAHVPALPASDLDTYHPALLAARRAVNLADADTTLASRERNPDWSFEAGFSQRGSQYANMLSFGVSIPLAVNRAQRQDRDIAEKAAMGTRARLQYDEALLEMQTQIQGLSAELDSLKERIAQWRAELLPAATQQVELATAGYRSGAASLSLVFKARRALLEKRLQLNALEKQAALAWASLELHVIPHDSGSATRSGQ